MAPSTRILAFVYPRAAGYAQPSLVSTRAESACAVWITVERQEVPATNGLRHAVWLPAGHAGNHQTILRHSRSTGLRTPSAPRLSTCR